MTDELEDNNPLDNIQNLYAFFAKNRLLIALFLLGLIFSGFGMFLYKVGYLGSDEKIEILSSSTSTIASETTAKKLIVEISGAVQNPGVYELDDGARIENILILAGGISTDADRVWFEKNINRAAKLIDGQKLYIVKEGESSQAQLQQSLGVSANNNSSTVIGNSDASFLININTASLQELDSLPGIGQVYGQNIIEHRPYSTTEELLTRGVLKQNVYDKIKNMISL